MLLEYSFFLSFLPLPLTFLLVAILEGGKAERERGMEAIGVEIVCVYRGGGVRVCVGACVRVRGSRAILIWWANGEKGKAKMGNYCLLLHSLDCKSNVRAALP